MKILALMSRPMVQPLYGETLRSYHLLSGLSKKHDVSLLSFARDMQSCEKPYITPGDVSHMEFVPFNKHLAALKTILALPGTKPAQVTYLSSSAMRTAVRSACHSFKPDILFVHMARIAQYAKEAQGIPVVLDLVDSFSLHLGSYAGIGAMRSKLLMRLETKKMARYECECVSRADLSVAASERDVEAVRNSPYFNGGRIEVLPNGVDTEYFSPKEVSKDNSIVFVGNLAYPPNEDAVLWFVQEVFPKVTESAPQAKFVVVGMNPSPRILSLARPGQIEVTGKVPDVRPYIWRAAVSVAPLRKAGGIQNKVLEAMACATPSVITPAAAAGIEALPGKDFEVADTPSDFATKVLSLLKNPEQAITIARAGRALIEKKYTWADVVLRLERMMANYQR